MNFSASVEDSLNAYATGAFPMAASRDAAAYEWFIAPIRSLLPICTLHIPRKLKQVVRQGRFDVRIDSDFASVIDGCAAPRAGQRETWINPGLKAMLLDLHRAGFAHSVECWRDGRLAGGLYGIALGGVFCGESMFSRGTDASKVALVHLCARLWEGGFTLLDTQFLNPHLVQFGAYELSHEAYIGKLQALLDSPADFHLRNNSMQSERRLVATYLDMNARPTPGLLVNNLVR